MGAKIELDDVNAPELLSASVRLNVPDLVAQALKDGWQGNVIVGGEKWDAVWIARAFAANDVLRLLTTVDARKAQEISPLVSANLLDAAPRLLHSVALRYPQGDAYRGQTASLHFEVIINDQGNIILPIVRAPIKGEDIESLATTLTKWQFAPPKQNGKPVAVHLMIPVAIKAAPSRVFDLSEVDKYPQLITPAAAIGDDALRTASAAEPTRVEFIVGADGSVTKTAQYTGEDRKLMQLARETVSKWRFTPAEINGVPVTVRLRVSFARNPGSGTSK